LRYSKEYLKKLLPKPLFHKRVSEEYLDTIEEPDRCIANLWVAESTSQLQSKGEGSSMISPTAIGVYLSAAAVKMLASVDRLQASAAEGRLVDVAGKLKGGI
jgi:hypothetical protein